MLTVGTMQTRQLSPCLRAVLVRVAVEDPLAHAAAVLQMHLTQKNMKI